LRASLIARPCFPHCKTAVQRYTPTSSQSIHRTASLHSQGSSQVSNCHFRKPFSCVSAFGGARVAILTSAVFMYSCAAAAQTFLCAFASAFLQSREQYCTLLHVIHGLRLGFSGSASGVAHLAQAAGGWLSDAIDVVGKVVCCVPCVSAMIPVRETFGWRNCYARLLGPASQAREEGDQSFLAGVQY